MASLGFSGHAEAVDTNRGAVRERKAEETGSVLAERLADLAGIVQSEVVPRLVQAHRPLTNEPSVPPANLSEPQEGVVEQLAELAVKDGVAAKAYVEQLRDQGMSVESIYLNVLAPTARLLGELWEADRRHFADVTIGVGRLQQMLREFEAAFQGTARVSGPALRVLLMSAPDEQHTFGLFMLGEFMRRAGWDAWTGPLPPERKLKRLIARGDFSVIGFSASSDCRLDRLAEAIASVRGMAKRRRLCVMVGGSVFIDRPALATEIGADGTARDANEAINLAQKLVDESDGSSRTGCRKKG